MFTGGATMPKKAAVAMNAPVRARDKPALSSTGAIIAPVVSTQGAVSPVSMPGNITKSVSSTSSSRGQRPSERTVTVFSVASAPERSKTAMKNSDVTTSRIGSR